MRPLGSVIYGRIVIGSLATCDPGLAATARAPVIASGVVRRPDDIARLKYIPNIAGVLVGRALFRKTVDLGQALAMAQPQPETVLSRP